MDSYEAIVYDLDGTLVELRVDWTQARDDTAETLRDAGLSVSGESLWQLREKAQDEGIESRVETVLSSHERDGARSSRLLQATNRLPHSVPTGVCTLNCEAACELALETHGIGGHIDAIVARDTLDTAKPDPEPLLETVRRLATTPEMTLFVGDSERDERTAERAGVDFQYVSSYLDTISTS
jgi:phosphoglycolate phosphatase-like HAD superfamily hydrolase